MKIKINRLILLFSFLIYTGYQSQINTLEKQIQNVASPEIASIMKYADFPELDYIGKSNISVPIYNVNLGKLTIPINLSYNTKGNKVADIATAVGLGWNLNAGGNVTVKVNDMNDLTETYSYYTTSSFEPEQSYAWHRQTKGFLNTQTPQADTGSLCNNNRIWESDDIVKDAAPDFYYLNAPGLSDKFYFTRTDDTHLKANFFNSNARLNNNPNLTVKTGCSGFASDPFGSQGKASSFYQIDKFEVTGENGYIYTFNNVESSIITEYPQDLLSHQSLQVNTWYLTKIKDPFSGREVNFEYEGYLNSYEHLTLTTLGNVDFGGSYPIASNIELGTSTSNFVHPYFFNKVTTSILAPKRLKKIITDQEIIDFNYSFNRIDYAGSGLSDIQIKDKNGKSIKQINFTYSYFEAAGCTSGNYECMRLRLDKMEDSTLGGYGFTYDNNNFPARNSSKVDYLGYFNNNDSNIIFSKNNFHENENDYYPGSKTYFYPTLNDNQILPFQLINRQFSGVIQGVDRTPSTISRLGLLQRIVYPTGGALELNYENDDFMYEGAKYILGSSRLNKMKLYDSQNNISKEVNYRYINTDNTSSGQINFISTPSNSVRTEIASGIGFNTGAIIGYSRIIEETVGKGYIERRYSNFSDYPDKFMKSDHNFTDQPTINFLKFLKFPHSYIQSFDGRRGKLLAENYFKEGVASPIKKVSYQYDYTVKDSLKVQKLFSNYANNNYYIGNYTASNYILRYFNNVKNSTQEALFGGNSIKEENSFLYDDTRLTYKKTISSGNTFEEYYRNAKDKSVQKLIDANILDRPLEVEKKMNGKTLSKQEVKYENISNLLPSSELSLNLQTNSMENEIRYDQYDSKGNLQQYTTKNGTPTVIIWGYNQTLPIVKIEGKDAPAFLTTFNTDIMALSNASNNDIDQATEETFKGKLDLFQKRQFNLDVLITTYTHDPLIGVTSINPPSGIRENYKFDTSNRLEKIQNTEKKIVKEYRYNYAPTKFYNSERSKTFAKYCGSGGIGSFYTYTVPANKYTSTISQSDADSKANDEIDTNGQNMANNNPNGTCTSINCSIAMSVSGGGGISVINPTTYQVNVGFSSGSNPAWTTTGVKIGYITGNCRPTVERTSGTYNNGVWSIIIRTNGDIIAKKVEGSVPDNTSYNLIFTYPIN